jgi:hypothetical protein
MTEKETKNYCPAADHFSNCPYFANICDGIMCEYNKKVLIKLAGKKKQ